MKIVFVLLGLIFVTIGVISIFDARKLTKKLFSFQDINEGTKVMKIFGIIVFILGLGVIYFYLPETADYIKSIIK